MKLSLASINSKSLGSTVPFGLSILLWACILIMGLLSSGCGTLDSALGLGKFKGIERTPSDEAFYLLKEFRLTAGSPTPKENFDHATNETVNLVFAVNNEKGVYVTESRWYDPNDEEYRIKRVTYDRTEEGKKGIERPKGGATRVHTMSTKELYDHKPGLWKVALYIDGQLARRQTFFVR